MIIKIPKQEANEISLLKIISIITKNIITIMNSVLRNQIIELRIAEKFKELTTLSKELTEENTHYSEAILKNKKLAVDLELCGIPSSNARITKLYDQNDDFISIAEDNQEAIDIISKLLENNNYHDE